MTRTLLHGGLVYDGTGSPPALADVVFDGDTIIDVGHGLDGDVGIDATGHTVLPGMFDCHVHVMFSGVDYLKGLARPFSLPFYESVVNLRTTVECGITSVRDAGGADLGVATAVRQGVVPGPRMQISVSALSQTGGHGDGWMPCGSEVKLFPPHPGRPSGICDGPDEARKKTREVLRAGADVIKIMTSGGVLSPRDDPRHGHFRDAEVAVMVEEAAAMGKYVMSHAQAASGIVTALRNGVRSVEHGIYLDDEGIGLLLEKEAWLVPTMIAPRMVLAMSAGGGLLPEVVQKAHMVVAAHEAAVRKAIAAGVRIAMGTDSGVGPHGDNLDEFRLLIEAGMTPEAALHSGTGSAAGLLGVAESLGTVEPGKKADLVLAEGNVLDLAQAGGSVFRKAIRGVWIDGAQIVGC
ncbi:metal-dependent hydrolase family protein [Longispora albida]|uniref:metal-dependent hydrolase family protein n=1 Tax=Longispora albida TaxID=203523 RepID=UPI000380427A|nr:amidohydrolase family protein [Longispora albida]